MPVSMSLIRMLDGVDQSLRTVLYAILEEIERQQQERVTRKEFQELTEAVARLASNVEELAAAQARTEKRLDELATAQARTEKRVDALAQRMEELAAAQARTEKRLDELAAAQARTEKQVDALAQRMEELAAAQVRNEQRLEALIGEHKKTRQMVGGLAHTVGYVLENESYLGLPPLLRQDHGIEVVEDLKRDYVLCGKAEVEVNIIGKGRRQDRDLWILGECKTQLTKRDIDTFLRHMERVRQVLPGDAFYVLVTHQAAPKTRQHAADRGVALYFSYQFGRTQQIV